METPKPIRLLNAPLLVGCEILRSMGFLDLFILARTSTLMRKIVRREIKIRNHTLGIFLQPGGFVFEFRKVGIEKGEESSISMRRTCRINSEKDHFIQKIGNYNVQSFMHQSPEEPPHLATYWTSLFPGVKEMYSEIHDVFRIPIRKVYIDLNSVGKHCKPVINWINSINSDIPLIQIAGDNISFEMYSWVFDNLRSTPEVHFLSKPEEFLTKEPVRITHEEILIKYGQWVNTEHLKLMESSCIHIENSTISDEEINKFFHDLRAGSNPNLRKIVFGMARDADASVVFADLNSNQIDEHKWIFQLKNGMECVVQNVAYEDDEQQGIEVEIGRREEIQDS
ncbi:hypothetical protein CAEBREN_07612 [Caenorhabditis brenneri]|uniref:Sdz-33 F-box domain-containing protein n=1 Tax=Caenorhabditis brenneri TaxID=135651 RepID=G0N2G0_CAEBE|nr:hypothetical protein CAEBREN_07612 [Caenorhabditis brenneri]